MTRRDAVWVVCFLIAGALGLTCYIQFFDRALPVASLNFRVDREQAYQSAEAYLHRLGYDLTDYESAQVFSYSSLPQVFLERTLGLEEANRLVREWVSVWYWNIRWFKPLQKEELRVRIDPGGRIVGFTHSILESDEGASLSEEDTRVIAETFLTDVQGFQLDDYEPIEASSTERPNRIDHTFTYRKKDFVVGDDGHYRLRVTVKGDKAGYFAEYLKVPETFSRNYREIRSRAGLLTNIASVFFFALGIAMVVVLVRKYRQRTLIWHAALGVGILVAATSFLGAVNGYPITRFGYDTTQSFVSFILTFIFGGLLSAVLSGVIIALSGTAGGAAAQDVEGWKNPLARLSLRGWRSASFARITLIGYGLAFAHLGYVTIFYILGNDYLGVWSPAAMTQYSNTYSTYLPWIYPLLIGLLAATMEEFFFRLLAISLLIRWLKKTWLAVLIPAIVWAFLHANYPQEPIYIRGLELTVVGVIFGIVFLRYGVWATIISHYVYNCFLGIYPMVQSDSLYFKVSGILAVAIIFIPAIPAIFGVITGRYKEVEEPEEVAPPELPEDTAPETAMPESEPPPEPEVERKTPSDYLIPKSGLVVFGVLGLIGWSVYFISDLPGFAKYARESMITRAEAIEKAEDLRRQLGLNLEGYQRTTSFSSSFGSSHFTHLIRNVDLARADTLAAEHTASWRWRVRWFKPLEKEELTISIDGNGDFCRVSHYVPESREGAELSTEEAQEIAEAFLSEYLQRDVTDTALYKRLEARSQKREDRMDHSFVWERTNIKVEEGEFRIIASVQGDQIGHAYKAYKAPEEFLRKLRERTAKSTIVSAVSTIAVIATAVIAIIFFLRAYRDGHVNWQLPICVGILSGVCFVLEKLNNLPVFYRGYNTSEAMSTFLGGELIGLVIDLVIAAIMAFLLCAFGDTMYRRERPGEMQISDWIDVLRLKINNTALWWQVVFLAVCYFGITRGTGIFSSYINLTYLGDYLGAGGGAPPEINSYIPAFGELIDEVKGMLLAPFAILGILFVWWRVIGKINLLILVVLLVLIFQSVVSPAKDFYHAGILIAKSIPYWVIMAFLILKYIRFNLLFYAVMAWCSIIFVGIRYLKYDPGIYQVNGILMILFGLVPLILAVLAWYKARSSA